MALMSCLYDLLQDGVFLTIFLYFLRILFRFCCNSWTSILTGTFYMNIKMIFE